jgi:hypothetical protein
MSEIPMPSDEQIESFCRSHYYCDYPTCKVKWEPFEDYSDEYIAEQVDNDIVALQHFLKGA